MRAKTRHHGAEVYIDPRDVPLFEAHAWRVDKRGYLTRNKYVEMKNGKCRYAKVYFHRVVIGAKVGEEVDHINRIKTDNRLENLRIVPHCINTQNVGRRSSNTSGVTGVMWFSPAKLFVAEIKWFGYRRTLGYFHSFFDAVEARLNAEEALCE